MLWIFTGVVSWLTYGVIRSKNLRLPTATGAFIMAAGIFFNVYEKELPLVPLEIEVIISFLAALQIGFTMIFLQEAHKGMLYRRHLADPIASFATGTWVAAFSMMIITITSWLPSLRPLAVFFYVLDILLWFGFFILVIRNLIFLWKHDDQRRKVNGVILLSCVATQSVVIASVDLFGTHATSLKLLIAVGGSLYILCFVMIADRLLHFNWKNVSEDWTNTNCIIHGALSITGLAGVMTSAFSVSESGGLWLITSILFACVEGIELVRIYQRICRWGWLRGVFVYNTTQWARNFTFGMFMAFTINLPWQSCRFCQAAPLHLWRVIWLDVGIPFLLLLLSVELALFIKHFLVDQDPASSEQQKTHLGKF